MSNISNGFINGIVSLACAISIVITGHFSEVLIQKDLLSRTCCRKLFESIACIGLGACTALAPIASHATTTIILLVIGHVFLGFTAGGDNPIPGELSVNFPATIFAIINTLTSLTATIVPYAVGVVLESNLSDSPVTLWSIVFYFSAFLTLLSAVVFVLFGSAERQSWDYFVSSQIEDAEQSVPKDDLEKETEEEYFEREIRRRSSIINTEY